MIGGGENHQGIQLSTCSPMVLEHAPALDSFGAFAKPAPFAGLPRRAAGVVTMHMGGAGGTRRARTTPRQWQTRDPTKPSELFDAILLWATQLGRHSQHAHRARSALRCSSACPWAKMHGPQHKRAQWQHSSAFKSYPQTWSRQGWKVASQAARDRRDGLRGVLEHSVMMGACV